MDKKRNIKKVSSSTFSMFNSSWPHTSAIIHGLSENDKHMYEMYDRFGPTPRICFDYISNPSALLRHQADRNKALENLSSVTLLQMVDNSKLLTMDSTSHTLLLMKRRSELRILDSTDDYASIDAFFKPRIEFVSPVVESEIRARLLEREPNNSNLTDNWWPLNRRGAVHRRSCVRNLGPFEARREINLELVDNPNRTGRFSLTIVNNVYYSRDRRNQQPIFFLALWVTRGKLGRADHLFFAPTARVGDCLIDFQWISLVSSSRSPKHL